MQTVDIRLCVCPRSPCLQSSVISSCERGKRYQFGSVSWGFMEMEKEGRMRVTVLLSLNSRGRCFGEETTVPEHKDICVGQIDYIGKPLRQISQRDPKQKVSRLRVFKIFNACVSAGLLSRPVALVMSGRLNSWQRASRQGHVRRPSSVFASLLECTSQAHRGAPEVQSLDS